MIFFAIVIVKLMEKKVLDIRKPHYSEQILPVPWPLVISSSTVPNQELTIKLLFKKRERRRRASSAVLASLQKQLCLLALRHWGCFERRNVCDLATEIPY